MAVAAKKQSDKWKTYRTRFLVKAIQLEEAMSFTDALGREHKGRKGDYLVESIEGVRSIAPRKVFEDVYVAITREEELATKLASRKALKSASSTPRSKAGKAGAATREASAFHDQLLPEADAQLNLLSGSGAGLRIAAASSEREARPPRKSVQRVSRTRAGSGTRPAAQAS